MANLPVKSTNITDLPVIPSMEGTKVFVMKNRALGWAEYKEDKATDYSKDIQEIKMKFNQFLERLDQLTELVNSKTTSETPAEKTVTTKKTSKKKSAE